MHAVETSSSVGHMHVYAMDEFFIGMLRHANVNVEKECRIKVLVCMLTNSVVLFLHLCVCLYPFVLFVPFPHHACTVLAKDNAV